MTVLIRPVPTRVAGNRIVPFRQVQYTNKVRPVSLGDWKPPVPEPLPPAPLLGLGTLAVLGAQALAYAWGQLNSRPPTTQGTALLPGLTGSGTVPAGSNTVAGTFTYGLSSGTFVQAAPNCQPMPAQAGGAFGPTVLTNVLTARLGTNGFECAPLAIGFWIKRQGESTETFRSIFATGKGILNFSRSITSSFSGANTEVWQEGVTEAQIPDGYVVPQIEPASNPTPSRTTPAPLPLPLPSTVPSDPLQEPETLPAPSPLVPVTPGPAAPPIVQPGTPISPQQPKTPGSTGTTNGIVNAPARVPVPVTDPTAITPWPGAQPIPGIGTSPAPTLVGIAQEVGRIERKLEVMNNPNAPGNLVDRFGDLANLIGPIIEAILAATSGTTYTLDSPCEVDAEGDRLPAIEVEAPGAPTQFGAILNRIDALAELLQVHKDLKQPNCRGADVPVGGEFVTVNFEQID